MAKVLFESVLAVWVQGCGDPGQFQQNFNTNLLKTRAKVSIMAVVFIVLIDLLTLARVFKKFA